MVAPVGALIPGLVGDMAKKESPTSSVEEPARTAPKPLEVKTHRALVAKRRQIIAAVAGKPELLPLLAINPVLVFKEVGVDLSPEMSDHVLRSLQHPPAIRAERERLVAELREELGEAPSPNDPAWVAQWLFTTLEVAPLRTDGARPAYVSAIPPDALERLQTLRRSRRSADRSFFAGPVDDGGRGAPLIRLPDSVLRLDLEVPVPALPPADGPPDEVTLEALWFYRDAHPSVPPMLRLGIIERSAVPIFSPDGYRKAKTGERPSQLLRWIKDVRFQPDKPPR
ncbi:MAG TPA: hypothetical protein VM142_04510 [Acidimicrobiales bacterium]|nr:hypothetical protein [Acidimicrobiales bacterium]